MPGDGSFRRLPERWVCAAASRDLTKLLLFLAATVAATAVALAKAQTDATRELLWALLLGLAFHGFGQWRFRRNLRSCATEMERALEEKEPRPIVVDPAPRRRGVRATRSPDYLSSGSPTAHFAMQSTAVLLWGALSLVCREVDVMANLAAAACVAFMAFEGVGYHQVLGRRRQEVATLLRCRRRLAKVSST